MLKPIQEKRVSDLIVEQIDEMIVSKKLKPGQMLSSERELVNELLVSRASHELILEMKKSLEHFIHCKNDNNTIGMIEYDSGFHNLIAQATNNRTLSVL